MFFITKTALANFCSTVISNFVSNNLFPSISALFIDMTGALYPDESTFMLLLPDVDVEVVSTALTLLAADLLFISDSPTTLLT